jgi:hypothetical protein
MTAICMLGVPRGSSRFSFFHSGKRQATKLSDPPCQYQVIGDRTIMVVIDSVWIHRNILRAKYSQKPQLSSSHPIVRFPVWDA